MKIALAHDWLVGLGGAETVLEQMFSIYPDSDVFTLFSDKKYISNTIFREANIFNSSLQNIPKIQSIYRKLPNLFPMAIEEFEFTDYDVVLSSSHAVAKGVLTDAKTCHISYIHTPMRYIWDLTHDYIRRANFPFLLEWYTKKVFHDLRTWDMISSVRPDYLIANSKFIQNRIQKVYRRESTVIYPPVELSKDVYTDKDNYYIAASRHVPYKNIPLIAEAFAGMPDKKLIILGDGPDSKKVESICQHAKNIEYRGFQSRTNLMNLIGKAKAFVFAAEEDFGILPVEAQSLGTPVIAYGVGGAKETIIDNKTGVFFDSQKIESIQKAVNKFESIEDSFDYTQIAEHSKQFSQDTFKNRLKDFIERSHQDFHR